MIPVNKHQVRQQTPRTQRDARPITNEDDAPGFWGFVCAVGVVVFAIWLVTTVLFALGG